MKWFAALSLIIMAMGCQRKVERAPSQLQTELIDAQGTWKISSPNSGEITLVLDSDGTAMLKRNGDEVQGAWEALGDQLWIFWADGWIDLIQRDGNDYSVQSFGPGTALDATPDRTAAARKTSAN